MKGLDHQRHSAKKKPVHTLKEKRAEKRAHRHEREMEASGVTKLPTTELAH